MTMTIPLIVFAVLCFFAFFSLNPFGASSGWFFGAMPRPETVVPASVAAEGIETFEEALHHSHTPAMVLSLTIAGLGVLAAFGTYFWKRINADAVAERLKPVHRFLLNKWYFDELYGATVVRGTVGLAKLYRWFDNVVIDGLVNGTASWTKAVTLGAKQNWEEGKLGALIYIVAMAGVSLYVGWVVGAGLIPAGASVAEILAYVLLGLAVAGLTFFLFYAGVGGFDNRIVDGLVNATAYVAGFFGLLTRRVQTGKVQTYLAFVILGVMIFFLWFR
jgi:NADH-quinone oxidoreductase subunit L